MNEGLSPIFNPTKIELYESPLLNYPALSADVITWTHNLGFKLIDVDVIAICITADQGYVVDDEISLTNVVWTNSTVSQEFGFVVTQNINSISIIAGAIATWLIGYHKTTGAIVNFTASNWKFKIRGERITVGDIPDITTVGMVPIEHKILFNTAAFGIDLDINNYHSFRIDIPWVFPKTDGTTFFSRTSSDGGATYALAAASYGWMRGGAAATAAIGTGIETDTQIEWAVLVSTTRPLQGEIRIWAAGLNQWTALKFNGGFRANTPASFSLEVFAQRYDAGIVNNILLGMFSGNMDIEYTLYGFRNL